MNFSSYIVASWKGVVRMFGGGTTNQDVLGTQERDAILQEATAYAGDWRLHIVACTAKFAKVDGVVSKNELAVVEEVFGSLDLTGAQRPLAISTFQSAKTGAATFDQCVQFYLERYRQEMDLLQILVGILFAIAQADGEPNAQTHQALAGVCQSMGLDYDQCVEASTRKRANPKPNNVQSAYTILGCTPNDPLNVVRDKYRKLAKDFHPDTVMSKGLSAEFVKFAEERFKQIQAAYETVIEARAAKEV